jgi:hypothetical protein
MSTYRGSVNLWHIADDAARAAGLNWPGLFHDVCDEPKRQHGRTPRDVYGEMIQWTPEQWQQWATERADEVRAREWRRQASDERPPL